MPRLWTAFNHVIRIGSRSTRITAHWWRWLQHGACMIDRRLIHSSTLNVCVCSGDWRGVANSTEEGIANRSECRKRRSVILEVWYSTHNFFTYSRKSVAECCFFSTFGYTEALNEKRYWEFHRKIPSEYLKTRGSTNRHFWRYRSSVFGIALLVKMSCFQL